MRRCVFSTCINTGMKFHRSKLAIRGLTVYPEMDGSAIDYRAISMKYLQGCSLCSVSSPLETREGTPPVYV